MAARLKQTIIASMTALVVLAGCTSTAPAPSEAAVSINEQLPDPTPLPSVTAAPTANPAPTTTAVPTSEPTPAPTEGAAGGANATTATVSLNGNRLESLTQALDAATDGDVVEIGPGELFTPGLHAITTELLIIGAGPDLTTVTATGNSAPRPRSSSTTESVSTPGRRSPHRVARCAHNIAHNTQTARKPSRFRLCESILSRRSACRA